MTVEAAVAVIHRLELLLGSQWVTVFDAPARAADAPRWVVDGIAPRAVVRPADAEQIAAVLRLCAESGAAVVPWGGGTAMGVGNPPRAADVILLTERLSRIVEHDHSNLTITVESGITLDTLGAALAAHNQFLPLDPPRAESATAGGAVAVNLHGPRRMRYGAARDLVIGLGAVLTGGTVIKAGGKTVKNVAGYDMCKFFVGSMGTLGVLTELTFKVSPMPEMSRTMAVWGAHLPAPAALARRVLTSQLLPSAVTIINGAASASFGRGAAGLLVAVEGVEAAVARHERDITAWAADAGLDPETLAGDDERALWQAVRDFGWTAAAAVRLTVPPGEVAACVARLTAAFPATAGIVAHAGSGTIWISLEAADLTPATRRTLHDLVERHSGNLLMARVPHAIKTEGDVWSPQPHPRALDVMRGLKQSFDPSGILNPGRFVAGM
ncbi:MAG: FAD-binding oxidoreductase [Armatimonadota bacterium]